MGHEASMFKITSSKSFHFEWFGASRLFKPSRVCRKTLSCNFVGARNMAVEQFYRPHTNFYIGPWSLPARPAKTALAYVSQAAPFRPALQNVPRHVSTRLFRSGPPCIAICRSGQLTHHIRIQLRLRSTWTGG